MVGRTATDAELCSRILEGDKAAFATVYDRYADPLYDYAYSVLRDHREAADAIQETFLVVANRLNQLDDPDCLRPWLYAITRNCALHTIREHEREVPDEVEREAELNELRDLVWAAAAELSENEQSLLNLHLRHGLTDTELGAALGISSIQANVTVSRLRDEVEKSIGALLVTRQARKDCDGLRQLLGDRKRVVRHVEACPTCSDRRKALVSPLVLLGSIPFFVAPPSLRDRVLSNVQLVALSTPIPVYRRPKIVASAALIVIVSIILAILLWPRPKAEPRPVSLADVTPPEIFNQYASATAIFEDGCQPQQVIVKADVTDNDRLETVEIHWDGPASAPMEYQDGDWSATLGPFESAQLIHWQIVATDVAGNVRFGDDQVLRVEACTG
ncbi:RNA polymerase sigma factor [Smaragdicoccus niigatensis]|uniref:RNA polymerase sigma factor n=1 Tax=Smaragdicoccus niigatensis TaxID=359359 RepID=UPI00039CDE27|nr:sigma-70 family RNA polymerase sigma factor [Smaragdicoccus niigatensis]